MRRLTISMSCPWYSCTALRMRWCVMSLLKRLNTANISSGPLATPSARCSSSTTLCSTAPTRLSYCSTRAFQNRSGTLSTLYPSVNTPYASSTSCTRRSASPALAPLEMLLLLLLPPNTAWRARLKSSQALRMSYISAKRALIAVDSSYESEMERLRSAEVSLSLLMTASKRWTASAKSSRTWRKASKETTMIHSPRASSTALRTTSLPMV